MGEKFPSPLLHHAGSRKQASKKLNSKQYVSQQRTLLGIWFFPFRSIPCLPAF